VSQKTQILDALKKIGKGTTLQIFEAIPISDTNNWKAKNKQGSVSGELSRLQKEGIIKQKGKIWALDKKRPSKNLIIKKNSNDVIEKCLYLITIHPFIKHSYAGLPFKIGLCGNDDLRGRIKAYNACLPFETISFISSFPIQLPDGIDLDRIEKKVHLILATNNNCLGFCVRRIHGGYQKEWFTATDLKPTKEHIDKLAKAVERFVKEITKLI
jgi:hypothetical protein